MATSFWGQVQKPKPPVPVAPAPGVAPAPTPGVQPYQGGMVQQRAPVTAAPTAPAPMPPTPGYMPGGEIARPQQPPPGGVVVPPPQPPQPQQPDGGGDRFITPFGPGNDLVYGQINPEGSDRLKQYQDQLLSYSQGLADTPDRNELARQSWEQIAQASEPEFQKELQGVGQKAAALGRIGSGITTSELGDVTLQREKYLGNLQRQLATEASGQTLSDRLARLQAGQGLEAQQYGQEAGNRAELRGERGYQHDVAQEPYQQQLQQIALRDALINSEFGRQLQAGQLGLEGAQMYGQQAGDAGGTASDLLQQLALQDYFKRAGQQQPPTAGAQDYLGQDYADPNAPQFPPTEYDLPPSPLFPVKRYNFGQP